MTASDALKELLDEYKKHNLQPESILVDTSVIEEIKNSGLVDNIKVETSCVLGNSPFQVFPTIEQLMYFAPHEHKLHLTMIDKRAFFISNVFPDRREDYKFIKVNNSGAVMISLSKLSCSRRDLENFGSFDYAAHALEHQRWANLGYQFGITSIQLNDGDCQHSCRLG